MPHSQIDMRERYRRELVDLVEKQLPACKIYLFGSRARGTAASGADIDVAIDANRPLLLEELTALYGAIDESLIPVKVDLIDFFTASGEMRASIEKDRVIWKS